MKLAGSLLICAIAAAAQQTGEVRVSANVYTPPQLHLSAQATLVQLEVVVRDSKGHARSGLKQADFEVFDESKPRDIVAFSVESRAATEPAEATGKQVPVDLKTLPASIRSVLFFFDNLHGTPAELQRAQFAARHFIHGGMGPGTRAAVFAASEGLMLDFTADRDALTAVVDKLRAHQRLSENGLQPCPRITPYQAYLIEHNDFDALNAAVQEAQNCMNTDPSTRGSQKRNPSLTSARNMNGTVLTVKAQASATWQQAQNDAQASFDAVDNALGLLARAPGARVLVMASTGFLSGSLDSERAEVIDRAIRAGIVINALDAKGLWSEAPGRVSETGGALPMAAFLFETSTIGSRNEALNLPMAEFASGTGGLFLHNSNDLVAGFSQLAAMPETIYLLAMRPDPEGSARKYHKLNVKLTSKSSDYVQVRPGYFATAAPAAQTKAESRPLDSALLSSEELTAIPIQVTTRPGKAQNGDPSVTALIHVDLAGLRFTQQEDRHSQKLLFVAALLDPTDKMIAAKEGSMDLALKDDTFARLTASGVNASLTFAAPGGPYKLRVVVQDADGKLASVTQSTTSQ